MFADSSYQTLIVSASGLANIQWTTPLSTADADQIAIHIGIQIPGLAVADTLNVRVQWAADTFVTYGSVYWVWDTFVYPPSTPSGTTSALTPQVNELVIPDPMTGNPIVWTMPTVGHKMRVGIYSAAFSIAQTIPLFIERIRTGAAQQA